MAAALDRKLRQAAAALAAGDPTAAESLSREILERAPRHRSRQTHAAALSLLGIALASQQRHRESAACFREAAAAEPGDPAMHLNQGLALMQSGELAEALACIEKAISIRPGYPQALNSLGSVLQEQGRLDAAIDAYHRALAFDPNYAEAHNNLGNALLAQNPAEAIACFERAIALQPDLADAHYNLGNALQGQRRLEVAIDSYRRALELNAGHALAHNNLGNALRERGELENATRSFERAIALKPDYAKAHYNLGAARADQGRWEEAIACCERALALDASAPDAQHNLGLVRLFRQQFEAAWPLYEQRLNCAGSRERLRKQEATLGLYERLPHWRGPREAHAGEVGIWAEQGIGDQLLFSSLIPELIAAGVPFIYEVDQRLLGAYERAFPGQRFVALSDPPHAALTQAGRALLAGSLPGLFRLSRADFARQPRRLLQALPQRVAHYRGRLDDLGAGLKVAFSWQSNREDRLGPRKSAPLAQFAPLLQLPGVHFVDVQYGDTRAERAELERATGVRLLHFDAVDYFNDLEELLAILEACDVLITTSNVNAHLAGALGQPVWLMYLGDNPPFHYWAHDGGYRSLWYPAVEIVSAPQLTEWATLIRYTADKLKQTHVDGAARAERK